MIENIELKNIKPSGFNPRKTFSEEALNELAASIKEQGVLQPIVVRPKGKNKYEIVCGERRWKFQCNCPLESNLNCPPLNFPQK